jgi:hypothetical protein
VSQQTTNRSFDELAKGLATGTLSRGKAIRLVGGALLGATLASVPGVALADDDCRRFGRRCRRDRQCCSKNCVRRGDDKVCGCPEGKTRCGGRCVSNCTGGGTLDPDTCECGCPNGQVPCNGSCVSGCPTSQTLNTTTCQCECPSGSVELSNGTCATPCFGTDCPGCFSCARAIADNYCFNLGGSTAPCATDSECPTGEFCTGFICEVACTPSAPPPA